MSARTRHAHTAMFLFVPAITVAAVVGEPVSLNFTASPAAIAFTPQFAAGADPVTYNYASASLFLPPAPLASAMSVPMMLQRYAPAAAMLAASNPGDIVAVGAQPQGSIFLMARELAPGQTPVVGVKPEGPHGTFHLTEDAAHAVQNHLSDGDHAAAHALLNGLMDGAKKFADEAAVVVGASAGRSTDGPLALDAPESTPFAQRFVHRDTFIEDGARTAQKYFNNGNYAMAHALLDETMYYAKKLTDDAFIIVRPR